MNGTPPPFSFRLLARNVKVAREHVHFANRSSKLIDHYSDHMSKSKRAPSKRASLERADREWAAQNPEEPPLCQGLPCEEESRDYLSHVLSLRDLGYYLPLEARRQSALGLDAEEAFEELIANDPMDVQRNLSGELTRQRPVVFLTPTDLLRNALKDRSSSDTPANAARDLLGLDMNSGKLVAFHLPAGDQIKGFSAHRPTFVDAGFHRYFIAWSSPEGASKCGHTWDHGEGGKGLPEIVSGPVPLSNEIEVEYLGEVERPVTTSPERLAGVQP